VAVTRWGKKVTALPLIEMLVWQRERRTDQSRNAQRRATEASS